MTTRPCDLPAALADALQAFNKQLHGRILIVVNETEEGRYGAWHALVMSELVSRIMH